MGSLIQDIKYGIRMLGRRPGVTAIAVLTLGLGIGANTAIFSVVDAVLLRPLPYPHPERIVFLAENSPQISDMSNSMENFDDWRKMNTVFESMAPYRGNVAILTGEGAPESLRMRQITAGLFPKRKCPAEGGYVVLRTSGDPASLTQAMRDAMRSVNPNIPISQIQTLADIVDENVAPRRLTVLLLGSFAGLALVLAAVGIYGVMSYTVTQRTQEIGIRIALGAARSDIFRLVVRGGMALLVIGIAFGLGGALYLSRFLGAMLFQVRPTDVWTFVSVPAILAAIGLAACIIPARRATSVDPILALRMD